MSVQSEGAADNKGRRPTTTERKRWKQNMTTKILVSRLFICHVYFRQDVVVLVNASGVRLQQSTVRSVRLQEL